MGYKNPLLDLPAGIEAVMRQLRAQAHIEAETAHRRRKGPMYAYWRAVSTYARHTAHALSKGRP